MNCSIPFGYCLKRVSTDGLRLKNTKKQKRTLQLLYACGLHYVLA